MNIKISHPFQKVIKLAFVRIRFSLFQFVILIDVSKVWFNSEILRLRANENHTYY